MFKQLNAYLGAKQGVIGVEVSPSGVPHFLNALKPHKDNIFFWHLGEGLKRMAPNPRETPENNTFEPIGVLNFIEEELNDSSRLYCLWNLKDFIKQNQLVKAKLFSLVFKLKGTNHTLLLLDYQIELGEMQELIPILEFGLPSAEEVEEQLILLTNQSNRLNPLLSVMVGERMVKSCVGLTLEEIGDVFRFAIFHLKENFTEETLIREFQEAKLSKLKRLGVEISNPPDVEVGGLANLKSWLNRRTFLFNQTELPQPKGLVLVGVPGCGKSLIAKSIGIMLNVPIMRLDMGAMYHSLLGATEANLRQVLKTAEAIAPCVLFIDELEKAFANAGGNTSTDNGVSQRIFGTFLTWLQEKTAPVFVVATANKIHSLPPEFLRKGRFDEIFFVDLPTYEERIEIFKAHLKKAQIKLSEAGIEWLAEMTEDFTGSEIGYLIDEARLLAVSSGRKIQKSDFETVRGEMQPQATSQYQEINEIRRWAKTYARCAS